MTPGTKLGPYEILSPLGAGGMGEVYRARDTNLGRDVAIKVLPEAFVRDADRMARFSREAKLLAALDHSNIASIYGLETSGATRALVMQLAEGPTLADQIAQGPIPIEDALKIARQIADALEYAHEKGIIHRDLKPANIKVAPDDTVKILDFGLAKAMESDAALTDMSTSPTLSRLATQAGILLGTASYMSPEQAKAKPVDRRADIWAFGSVLYEMLTGKKAFDGDTVTDTLAAVVRAEPDWSLLPAATPMRVRVLLQRCLQKDVRQRLQAIGDARISLDEVISGAPEAAVVGTPQISIPLWRRALPGAVGFFAGAILIGAAVWIFKPTPPAPLRPVERFDIAAPDPGADYVGALSPDGTRWVIGSGPRPSRLWLRRMDSPEAQPLEGTEGAYGIPFWSPDSRYIAFGATDGKLKIIDTEGGPPQVLCDSGPAVVGGFWTPDGKKIVFSDPDRAPYGLREVPAAGGESSPLSGIENPEGSEALLPILLPDNRHFLYMSGSAPRMAVYLGTLNGKSQSPRQLLTGVTLGLAYAPSPGAPGRGYLLFVRGTEAAGTLMAQPFDLGKLSLTGEPIRIAEGVSEANYAASLNGTLVYGSGGALPGTQITLFDRQGKILGTAGEPGEYSSAALSPDGKRVVASRRDPQSTAENLWMIDLARNVSTRFTFDAGQDLLPVWSPDGKHIVFASSRAGGIPKVYEKLSNGGSQAELLFKASEPILPLSWSSDARYLLLGEGDQSAATASVLRLDANGHAAGKPFPFVQEGVGIDLKFSPGPQGHPLWVAYASNESGRYEIYVRPFDPQSPTGTPPGGGKWQVSTEGGESPRWNGNGKELFYIAPNGTVMSEAVSGTSTAFQSSIPKPLFKPKGLGSQAHGYRYWDASADGKKFIFAVSPSASAAAPPTRFTVVLNWTSLLKK